MHRLLVVITYFLLGLTLASCGGNGDHNEKKAENDPRVMIPNQEGLEAGLEFQFTGPYETPIGTARVLGNFYNGGAYEVFAEIGPYTAYFTVGTWQYDDNQFTLTDQDSSEVILTDKDGETYSFIVVFRDTDVLLSATMNGLKEYVILEPEEEDTEVQPLAKNVLTTVDVFDQFLTIELFDDSSALLSRSADASDTAEGMWSYSDTVGLQITVNDSDYDIVLDGDNYVFDADLGGESRQFSVPRQAVEDAAAGNVAILFPTVVLPDRYGSFTDEQWNELWADKDVEAVGVVPPADYPATSIDGLFADILPREYFAPVSVEERGAVVRLDYQTYLYQLNENFDIPQEEWSPVTKTSYVYLPAGYSKARKYNTYYLMHGAGGEPDDWFKRNLVGDATVGKGDFVMLLDYLIANDLMEPTIFVSVTPNVDKSQLSKGLIQKINAGLEISNFIVEFEKDLIPTVEGMFGSYLEGITATDIVASREHRAFGGLSMGAYVVWNSMATTIDSIAYYAPLANGANQAPETPETAIDAIYTQMREGDNANHEVGFIFSHVGVKDHTWDVHLGTTNELYNISSGDLTYGTNFYLYTPENGTHTTKYFILGVINSMQVFFKANPVNPQ